MGPENGSPQRLLEGGRGSRWRAAEGQSQSPPRGTEGGEGGGAKALEAGGAGGGRGPREERGRETAVPAVGPWPRVTGDGAGAEGPSGTGGCLLRPG